MKVEEIKLAFENNQKFEFALIDDIDRANKDTVSALQKADNAWKAYQDYLTKADTPFRKMMTERANYLKATTNITGLLNKAVTSANELGIPVENVKGYTALKQNIKIGNEIIDTIDTFKDPSTFQ